MTLTKNRRRGGALALPGRSSLPVRCPGLSPLFAILTKTAGCVPQIAIPEGGVLRCVLPTSKLSTFKPSNDPLVPLQPKALGATIGIGTHSLRSEETTPLPPVSKTTRADIGNCSAPLPVTDSGQIGVVSRA